MAPPNIHPPVTPPVIPPQGPPKPPPGGFVDPPVPPDTTGPTGPVRGPNAPPPEPPPTGPTITTITPLGLTVTVVVADDQVTQAQDRHNTLAESATYTDEQIASLDPPPAADSVAAGLLAYSAQQRWTLAQGGITLNGMPMATDDATRQTITSAVVLAQTDPTVTIQWKGQDGTFVTLNATQIVAIGQAIAGFVQVCFSTESTIADGINATPPTITTKAQIDTAYKAIPTTITSPPPASP